VIAIYDLEVAWDGISTLSFGLLQFHGHGSWLVYEVALILQSTMMAADSRQAGRHSLGFELPDLASSTWEMDGPHQLQPLHHIMASKCYAMWP
jgi:hypothetical protein